MIKSIRAYWWLMSGRGKLVERLTLTRRVTRCLSLALDRHYNVACPNMHAAVNHINEPGVGDISKNYAVHVLKEAIAPQLTLYNWFEQIAHDSGSRERLPPYNSARFIKRGRAFYGSILSRWQAREQKLVSKIATVDRLSHAQVVAWFERSKNENISLDDLLL